MRLKLAFLTVLTLLTTFLSIVLAADDLDNYLQQLSKVDSTNGDAIPEPVPPIAVVRDYYELDPYYEQWINVQGFPVLAAAKVNPYVVKEVAWILEQMIGHREDVLRALILKKIRYSVIPVDEILTDIPEYRGINTPDFIIYNRRGIFGNRVVSGGEEGILHNSSYSGEIHEMAHAIHLAGMPLIDSTFDKRLNIAYKQALKKGLWQGEYATVNSAEYWAEGTIRWYLSDSDNFLKDIGTARRELKAYDPALATLLTEVYGDRQWQYSPVATRLHLPYLQGYDLRDRPMPPAGSTELAELVHQFSLPSSDGEGRWVDLKPYKQSEIPRLLESQDTNAWTTVIMWNFTHTNVQLYQVYPDGTERFMYNYTPHRIKDQPFTVNDVFLLKYPDGSIIAAYQAVEKIGRVLIGTPPKMGVITLADEPEIPQEDVNADGNINILDLILVAQDLGETVQLASPTDVFADGKVNILDLIKVAEAMGAGAAAPSAHPQTLEILTAADVRRWLTQAQHLDLTDAISQRGILMLQQLLAALIPKETSLLTNYPNPFNPETWIPYQLAKPTNVTLTIYAVDGRVIRTLALGHQPAGMYHSKNRAVYWDGRNEQGEPVASGVYFYTLEAGDFSATRKMLIRK